MTPIPFAPFEPDRSRYALQASTAIVNALPKADGWGPMPALVAISEALPDEPKGLVLVRSFTGTFTIYAGTTTKLYRLDTSTIPYAWIDVSRLSGGDYSVTAGYLWGFQQFGAYLYATNGTDVLQRINVNSGSEFDAAPGNPPVAQFIGTAGQHLVLARIVDAPNRVQWSAFNNGEIWEEGVRAASLQDLTTGDEVMAILGNEKGAIIVQRNAIQVMTAQVSATNAFTIEPINPSLGAIAPYSVVNIGAGRFVYLSERGFHMNVEGAPIGAERVDSWFLNEAVDRDLLADVQGVLDPYNKVVYWRFTNAETKDSIIGYAYQLDRWFHSVQAVQALAALATPGITIDGADLLFDTVDDATPPFDSRIFSGGRPTMAAIGADGKLGWFSGDSLAAMLDTADVQHAPPYRSFVQEAQVVTDAQTFTLRAGTASKLGGAVTFGAAVSPHASTGICHFRSSGLTHRYQMSIPAGADWSFATAVLPAFIAEGAR